MALIPIRVDRTSKPPIGTPLRSDGHWSVQGLAGLWELNEYGGSTVFDAVGGRHLSKSASERWVADGISSGKTVNTPAASSVSSGGVAEISPAAGITMLIRGNYKFVTMTAGLFNLGGTTPLTCGLLIEKPSATLRFLSRDASSNAYDINTSAVINNVETDVCMSGFLGSGDINLYLDGKFVAAAAKPAKWVPPTFNQISIGGLCRGVDELAVLGVSQRACLYLRALDATQVASISANPWQIYEPEIFWMDVGSMMSADVAWRVLEGRDFSSAWKINTLINQASTWKLYTLGTASSAWKVAASSSIEVAWKINALLSGSSAWAIATGIDKSTAWAILRSGTLDLTASWAIEAQLDRVTAWKLHTSSTLQTGWTIISGLSRDSAWKIASSLGREASWSVYNDIQCSTTWQVISDTMPDKIDKIVISTMTGRAVILTTTGTIIIT